jgi:hypothetical protein
MVRPLPDASSFGELSALLGARLAPPGRFG